MKKRINVNKFYGSQYHASAEVDVRERGGCLVYLLTILGRAMVPILAIAATVLMIRAGGLNLTLIWYALHDITWPCMFMGSIFIVIAMLVLDFGSSEKKELKEAEQYLVQIPAQIADITSEEVSADDSTKIRYTAWVSYQYNGVSYDLVPLGWYNSSMTVGSSVNVIIDSRKPNETFLVNESRVFTVTAALFMLPATIALIAGFAQGGH